MCRKKEFNSRVKIKSVSIFRLVERFANFWNCEDTAWCNCRLLLIVLLSSAQLSRVITAVAVNEHLSLTHGRRAGIKKLARRLNCIGAHQHLTVRSTAEEIALLRLSLPIAPLDCGSKTRESRGFPTWDPLQWHLDPRSKLTLPPSRSALVPPNFPHTCALGALRTVLFLSRCFLTCVVKTNANTLFDPSSLLSRASRRADVRPGEKE